MTEVRFYHLQNQTQKQVLPAMLGKALERGQRVLVKMSSPQDVEDMNDFLWSYNPDSFLPHGSTKDSYPENQPVLLTAEDENPNRAEVLILCHGAESDRHGEFKLCCEMLNGHDEAAVSQARERWKLYKEKEYDVTYWQQTSSGGWEQKS